MKVCDFTVPELELLRQNCNFTKDEQIAFECYAEEFTTEEIAEILNVSVSTAKRIKKKMDSKIHRIMK